MLARWVRSMKYRIVRIEEVGQAGQVASFTPKGVLIVHEQFGVDAKPTHGLIIEASDNLVAGERQGGVVTHVRTVP